ncbi:TAXI family TRAP transporter solute-binding subunit [Acuticoccus mangrovi]|uniref:TAXI family TRAP transporter solute-binding subunit n=1 Tax=Acuticoccus mangrovi TaxID=2796142 RepID=A0A934IS08_9HYPH|nr:TAXI family TRAP transporter solute-binding subunit [Acuticoccus mangrovi]MBJ3776604.1 TAXI family TRAP transporter solute-binding subunit [Acuticoccus mangrovi]
MALTTKALKRLTTAVGIVLVSTAPFAASAQERITIGTGSTGGVYYPLGGGMAEIFSKNIDGVSASAEVTGASIENSRRVGSGEMTLGIGNANTVYFAKNGEKPFRKAWPLEAVAALYPSTIQIIVRADSGIDSVADLEGKRVAVGPPGGSTRVMADAVFDGAGIDVQREYLDFTEATEALKDRNLDASVVLAGFPTPTVIDLATTADIKVLSLDEKNIEQTHEKYPYYIEGVIPAGTYDGQDTDVHTMNIWNILFVNEATDDELVYKMTKAIFDHIDELRAIHPAANQITPETAVDTPIDLAPGAERYYGEIGALH